MSLSKSSLRLAAVLLPWAVLLLLLLLLGPLYVRMATWGDITTFDLGARAFLRTGAFYHEMLFHSPPGMIWFQALVRSLVGWESTALRLADLAIFAAIVWLLVVCAVPRALSWGASGWMAVVLFLTYLHATEWSHCQRDIWLLLPAMGALVLRQRQGAALLSPAPQRLFGRAFGEGTLWGLAFLIKPFVALSALPCLLLVAVLVLRSRERREAMRLLALDGSGVLVGGLLVGAASVLLLYIGGDWPGFVESNFGGWQQDYFQATPSLLSRLSNALTTLWPLSIINLLAVPLSIYLIVDAVRRARLPREEVSEKSRLALLACFYLGWFFQANGLQMQFDYQVLPVVFLGWTLSLSWLLLHLPRLAYSVVLPIALLTLVSIHPLLESSRLTLWRDCWKGTNPDQLKDLLGSDPTYGRTSWQDLRGVIAFLYERGAGDREVTCWQFSPIPLHTELHLLPSTRFVFPGTCTAYFPGHRQLIMEETMASPQRYVVCDLIGSSIPPDQFRKPLKLPKSKSFPLCYPLVCHSGRYVVFEVPRVQKAEQRARSAMQR